MAANDTATLWRETDKLYIKALIKLSECAKPVEQRQDILNRLKAGHSQAPDAQAQLDSVKAILLEIEA